MLVVLVAVISIDGCLTRHHDEGASWASAADKQHFASALADADVYLMGSATYTEARDKIRQRLDRGHRRIIITRTPEKYEHDTVSGQLEFTSDPPRQIEIVCARMDIVVVRYSAEERSTTCSWAPAWWMSCS